MLDKRIRQKSIKRVGSIVVCSAFCPGSPKRDPLDSIFSENIFNIKKINTYITWVRYDKSKKIVKKWIVGLVLPLVWKTKPWCLFLEDLQTLHIPTNMKLDVWTQYRLLLSFLGGYFSSFKKILRQREICKKILKSGKILRNHRPGIIFILMESFLFIERWACIPTMLPSKLRWINYTSTKKNSWKKIMAILECRQKISHTGKVAETKG